jgi:hypothetical protein
MKHIRLFENFVEFDYHDFNKKYGGISILEFIGNQKNIEKMLSDIGPVQTLDYLNNLENIVKNDAQKAANYRRLTERDNATILALILKLRKKYISSVEVKSKSGDVFAVDDKGILYVNKIPVEVSDSFVKLGGNGRSASRGAFYGADYFDGQLQGIRYVHTIIPFKKALLAGKSPEDALKEIWNRGTGMKGETIANVWPEIAKHLKIKL